MKNITLIKKSILLLTLFGSIGSIGYAQGNFVQDSIEYFAGTSSSAGVMRLLDGKRKVCIVPASVSNNGKTYTVTYISGSSGIAESAFSGLDSLQKVVLPNTITGIGEGAFAQCPKLESVNIPEGINAIKNSTFFNCPSLSNITLPLTLKTIEGGAFSGCSSLQRITLPEGLTTIGAEAFLNCTQLKDITFSSTIRKIASDAFRNTAWYNNQPVGVIYAGNYACAYKGTMSENTAITLKDGTFGLLQNAFTDQKNLTSLTFPSSFTYVDAQALDGTAWLNHQTDGLVYAGNALYQYKGTMADSTAIVLKEGTKSISPNAFAGVTKLTSVKMPETVTMIGERAFDGCAGMKSIVIPSSVQNIDMWTTFGDAPTIKDITVEWKTPVQFDNSAFSYQIPSFLYPNCTLHIPAGTLQAYKVDEWAKFKIEEYKVDGISLAKAMDDISVAGKVVTSHRAQTVSLYDLTGRCLTTQKLSDGESLTLPSGTVIVKTERNSIICQ